jgi:hypothetical protein
VAEGWGHFQVSIDLAGLKKWSVGLAGSVPNFTFYSGEVRVVRRIILGQNSAQQWPGRFTSTFDGGLISF